jgi:hypothetical protein
MGKTGEAVTKVIATNRKATHDFSIHERFEAGLPVPGDTRIPAGFSLGIAARPLSVNFTAGLYLKWLCIAGRSKKCTASLAQLAP